MKYPQQWLMIIILHVFSNAAFSQHWSTIKDTSRISFYKRMQGNYFVHKIDSVKVVESDSVYTTYSAYWNPTTASIYLYDFSKEYVTGGDLSYSVTRFSRGIGRQQQLTYVSNSIGSGEVGEKLTYYKKGETIFGERVKYVIDGVEDGISASNEIRLYPNPASGYVSINIPANLPSMELILTDLTGLIIKQIRYKDEIDISILAPGLYIYTVNSGQQILKTGKLLINR